MGRTTTDFGIDLGTTNSVIACVEAGEVLVIKNALTNSDVTPSAVKLDRKGTVMVGLSAYNSLLDDPENSVGEFKRYMGNPSHNGFSFQRAGKAMTSAELSAEVLKALKSHVASRLGEDVGAAVITVPAMFLIPACEDTKAAARMAGINFSPLLQEPVAAAIAYGYKAETLGGYLLVFDLGGGTFDAALIASREGRLIVLGNDGDDKLGGKDYDWAVVDLLIDRLRSEFGDLGLRRDNPAAFGAMAKLKFKAEEAKCALSQQNSWPVELSNLPGCGDVDTTITLTRADIEHATRQLTSRAVGIARRLLTKHHLNGSELESVLLVGGQTRTPYLRERVAAEIGRIETKIDPMTIVAIGAALFASTQKLPERRTAPARQGITQIKIAYTPSAIDVEVDVGIALDPAPPAGASITIMRTDRGFTTGAMPVPPSGRLIATVLLRAKKANVFSVTLNDSKGNAIPTTEANFTIAHGLATAQVTTTRGFGVALVNNEGEILIKEGSPLPAKATHKFKSAVEIVASDEESVLAIHIFEGNYEKRANRNTPIGYIHLRGSELKRNLPAGEPIEVTLRLDESRILTGQAFFPNVNLVKVKEMERVPSRPELSAEEIQIELLQEQRRLRTIRAAAPDAINESTNVRIADVKRDLEATAGGDRDAAQKAFIDLLELKLSLDEVEKSREWELLCSELKEYREMTPELVNGCGTERQKADCQKWLIQADAAVAARSAEKLRTAIEELKSMYWRLLFAQDEFWTSQFQSLCEPDSRFTEPLRAEALIQEGHRAQKRGDISTLRTIVRDLWNLLETWQDGKLDLLFSDAGLARAHGQGR